jgi:hypothetical protein
MRSMNKLGGVRMSLNKNWECDYSHRGNITLKIPYYSCTKAEIIEVLL